ncbi:MAG: diaminopimelate epimerase [Helicobacteraceae bacterium]|nr:diaminopimelate epimerase [Helicobacteraceae bacterium]
MWLSKYSASGNNFLIFHTFKKGDYSNLAKKLCDRFEGIGADGLVALLPNEKFTYEWDFYNMDGSKANMCGNASRCVAHYAYSNNLAPKIHSFLSKAGEIKVSVEKDNVEVNFTKVILVKENIKQSIEDFIKTKNSVGQGDKDNKSKMLNFYLLDSGVPHLVVFVDSQKILPKNVNKMLTDLRKKYNANVNFAFIKDRKTALISTYERGVEDITKACGTGGAAVFYIANRLSLLDSSAVLIPPSKDKMHFRKVGDEVYFKGRVKKIADIKI